MSASQIFAGLALIIGLAVGCQILAVSFHIPAIILLLPVGFAAGALTSVVNPDEIFGAAFPPLVSLAVAIILFDGGLDLVRTGLTGDSRRVVHRLQGWGIPMTWAGAGLFGGLLLGLSWKAALMLGAILIVSGPTVVTPILRAARPGRRLTSILEFEGTTIDPIRAIIAVVVFQCLKASSAHQVLAGVLGFSGRIGVGAVGGAAGTAVLWLLVKKLKLTGILATEAIIATVITIAGFCDAIQDDTGLVAAIIMGAVLANMRGADVPEDRPFLKTIVQLTIGVLFISISATVTPASLRGVVWPTLGVLACLVLLVRPAVAAAATVRTSLTRSERISSDPWTRGVSSRHPLPRASLPRSSRWASAGRPGCCR
jgi:NhaP-type Na+/H+ or K+/H+ antiporter